MNKKSIKNNKTKYLSYIEKQINWHDEKAKKTKRIYRTTKVISICSSAMISLFAVVSSNFSGIQKYTAVATAVLATVVTVFESYTYASKHHSLSILYRKTSEKLIREKLLYELFLSPYDQSDENNNLNLFAQKCKDILDLTVEFWAETTKDSQVS